ncbi:YheU family protein [Parahaliea mediterranea]|uniref:YheU family protein n=1 Tax=Parahaliea mediterranea TaxID=651086 RepID=UPI001F49FCFA|nr:YheU family protein [Parahaliea mediterranea]
MARFIDIPPQRVPADTLCALLEEFASRDGTDYGSRELSLEEKVAQLRGGLDSGAMKLLYDSDSEHWDLVDRDRAAALFAEDGA